MTPVISHHACLPVSPAPVRSTCEAIDHFDHTPFPSMSSSSPSDAAVPFYSIPSLQGGEDPNFKFRQNRSCPLTSCRRRVRFVPAERRGGRRPLVLTCRPSSFLAIPLFCSSSFLLSKDGADPMLPAIIDEPSNDHQHRPRPPLFRSETQK